MLIEAGADVNERSPTKNYLAIDVAMLCKDVRLMKMLNDAGNRHLSSTFELLFAA